MWRLEVLVGATRSVSLSLSYVRWPNPSVISSHRPGTSGKLGVSGGLGGRDQGILLFFFFFLVNRIANCGEHGVKLDSSWWFQIPNTVCFWNEGLFFLGGFWAVFPPWCGFIGGQLLSDPSKYGFLKVFGASFRGQEPEDGTDYQIELVIEPAT